MTVDRSLRPDPAMEGRVEAWLTETDLTPTEAERGLDRFLDDFPVTPQARRRFLGRWLDRDEGAGRRTGEHGHPPVATNRRTRLMFSATALVAALAILAIGVSVVETGPGPFDTGAGGGATHVVAADGSGDYDTIQAAVDAAEDGDTVLVQPGTYTESVIVDKDIAVAGDGSPDEVTLRIGDDAPTFIFDGGDSEWPYGLSLMSADAAVSDLTVSGPSQAIAVLIDGGSPIIAGLLIDLEPFEDEGGERIIGMAFMVLGGATPSIRDSSWDAYFDIGDGAGPTIEGNVITANVISVNGPGTTTVRGNTFLDGAETSASDGAIGLIEDNEFSGGGIGIDTGSDMIVRGNDIRDAEENAISIERASALIEDNTVVGAEVGIQVDYGIDVTVRGNAIESTGGCGITIGGPGTDVVATGNVVRTSDTGICTSTSAAATIEDSDLIGNGTGIKLNSEDVHVSSNRIHENDVGLRILVGSPTIVGNTFTGNRAGLAFGPRPVTPTLTDNEFCENEVLVEVPDGTEPPALDGNEICEDAPAA